MTEPVITMSGGITLEGPFLEQVWAAYLVKEGHGVAVRRGHGGDVQWGAGLAPKYETLGSHHDVLLQGYDGSCTLYECTGQAQMPGDKIKKFAEDVRGLAAVLPLAGHGRLTRAVLVSASQESTWAGEAREVFERSRHGLGRDMGIQIESIEGLDLLEKLVGSGVLGLRMVKDRAHFVGPEDWGIRWNGKEFSWGQGLPENSKFKDIPHSFFPSHYWEMYYQEVVDEAIREMETRSEGRPAWGRGAFPVSWAYPFQYGVSWPSVGAMKTLGQALWIGPSGGVVKLQDERGFVELSWSRKHTYYSVHVFEASTAATRDKIAVAKGHASDLVERFKAEGDYPGERFSLHLYSASESWSSVAWAEAHQISDAALWDAPDVKRGNDFIRGLLNGVVTGILGFSFASSNQITLVGPGQKALRRTANGLAMSTGTE